MLALGFVEPARLHADPEESLHIDLPAISESWAVLEACVAATLMELRGLKRHARREIQQAVGRAFGDAVRIAESEAQARIGVTLSLVPELPELLIELRGIWHATFELPGVRGGECDVHPRGALRSGAGIGIGRRLIRRLVDQIHYRPKYKDNCWRLVRRLPGGGPYDNQGPYDQTYTLRLNLPALYKSIGVIQASIAKMLIQVAGLSEDDRLIYDLQLAAYEVGVNIVEYACGGHAGQIEAVLSFSPKTHEFMLDVHDTGRHPFNFTAVSDPTAPSWLSEQFRGMAWLFASAIPASGGFYLLNLLLSRWLGPAAFADFSLMMALILLASLFVTSFQYGAAKFADIYIFRRDRKRLAGLQTFLERAAWSVGGVLMLVLWFAAPLGAQLFDMSVWPFILLGLGIPFYVSRGVSRGLLQGQAQLEDLAISYYLEMGSQWLLVLVLVGLGAGLNGAILGIALSFVLSWWGAWRVGNGNSRAGFLAWLEALRSDANSRRVRTLSVEDRKTVLRFALPVIGAGVGQILLNTTDIILVRYFFEAESAGQYTALVLLIRAVFFFAWLLGVMLLFRMSRGPKSETTSYHRLGFSLGLVALMSVVVLALARFAPDVMVRGFLNGAYLALLPLLWPYAIAMTMYALSSVLLSYGFAVGYTGSALLSLAVGVVQAVALVFFHRDLTQVVQVQMVVMFGFFFVLLLWIVGVRLVNNLRKSVT